MNLELLKKIQEAEKNFNGTSFESVVKEAWSQFSSNKTNGAEELLDKLPTPQSLLKNLIEKLQGKPVYKTLRKINEGTATSTNEMLKGLFSLSTHIVIECQHGNPEYKMLLPILHTKIGELIYKSD